MADTYQYYVDNDYIDTEYFDSTYVADASASLSSSFSVSLLDIGITVYTNTDTQDYIEVGYIDADYFEQVSAIEANATLSSSFTSVSNGGLLLETEVDINSAFTPILTASVVRSNSVVADANFNMSATVSKFTGNEATLNNIVNLSLQAGIIYPFTASLSSSFTQLSSASKIHNTLASFTSSFELNAEGQIPSRIVSYTKTSNDYFDDILITTADSKWGTGSARLDRTASEIVPFVSLYDGEEYVAVGNGLTWTSTDGITWSSESNSFSSSTNPALYQWIKYINNRFFVYFNGTFSSEFGTSWTTSGANESIIYSGGYYYQYQTDGTYDGIERNTGQGVTGWSDVFNNNRNGDESRLLRTSVTDTIFMYRYDGSNYTIYDFIPGDTSWNELFTETERVLTSAGIARDSNSNLYYVTYDISTTPTTYKVKKYTDSTSAISTIFTTSSTTETNKFIQRIDIVNGQYILTVGDSVSPGTYGLLIDSSGFNDWTAGSFDVDTINNYGNQKFTYANNKFTYLTDIDIDINGPRLAYATDSTFTSFSATSQIPTQEANSSRLRYSTLDVDTWKTIDFWFKINSTSIAERLFSFGELYVNATNNPSPGYNVITTSFGSTGITYTGNNFSNWTHIRISRDNTNVSLYINGNRYINSTVDLSTIDVNYIDIFGDAVGTSNIDDIYIDEFLVTNQLLTNPTDTSYVVPTETYTNNSNTQLLLHFNNTFEDDNTPPNEAYLNVNATLTTIIGVIKPFNANLTTNGAQLTAISRFAGFGADITSNTSIVASGTRIKSFDSAQSSSFTSIINVDKIVGYTANINAISTQSAIITKIHPGSALLQVAAAQLTAIGYIGDVGAELNSEFTVIANIGSIQPVSANISGAFTAIMTAVATRTTDIDLQAEFTNITDAVKITDTNININVNSTQSTTITRIKSFEALLSDNVSFNLTAETSVGFNADLSSSFTLSGTTKIIEGLGALLDVESSMSITPIRTRNFAVAINSITTFTADTKTYTMFEYVVPKEIREFSIDAETKEYAILQEVREFALE